MSENQDLVFFEGQKTEVVLPSGRLVTIRETNGADDELLSTIGNIKDASSFTKFLTSIITNDSVLGKKPEAKDVVNYHLNDRYYLILKQRIINKGAELIFNVTCDEDSCSKKGKQEFVEDLSTLDGNLGDPKYTSKLSQIMKYPLGLNLEHEFTTSSGRSIKFELMTGVHDIKRLDVADMEQNKNTPLYVRNLKVKVNGDWTTVTTCAIFSSRELSEIRKKIYQIDPEFNPVIKGNCRYCNKPFMVGLFSLPDFFWPEETM